MEEQFYLLFPLIFLLIKGNSRKLLLTGAALIAVSAAHLVIQGNAELDVDRVIWVNPFAQMMFFGAGMLCAAFVMEWKIRPAAGARTALLCFALLCFYAVPLLSDAKHLGPSTSGISVSVGYLLATVGCIALFFALWHARVSQFRIAIYLGKISFGLYVFHILGILFTRHELRSLGLEPGGVFTMIFSLFVTIILAAMSYEFLEKPFLRLRKRFTVVQNRPV